MAEVISESFEWLGSFQRVLNVVHSLIQQCASISEGSAEGQHSECCLCLSS